MGISSGTSTRWLVVHSIQIELEIEKKKQTKKPTPKTNKQTYRRLAIFIALASNLPKRTSYFVDSMMIDVSIATVYS